MIDPIWQEGYQAFRDGDDESDNPYAEGSYNHQLWQQGFSQAEDDED